MAPKTRLKKIRKLENKKICICVMAPKPGLLLNCVNDYKNRPRMDLPPSAFIPRGDGSTVCRRPDVVPDVDGRMPMAGLAGC